MAQNARMASLFSPKVPIMVKTKQCEFEVDTLVPNLRIQMT